MAEGGQMPIFRRLPKRGFSNAVFRRRFSIVNLKDLEKRFSTGDVVTVQALIEARLVRNDHLPVKILGDGPLSKKLTVEAAKFSKKASERIQSAGGEARVV
jgi:large subunit ribosomal protein L15